MRVGLLWLDDGKKPLVEKVAEAANHFEWKYGKRPDTAHVHPSSIINEPEWDNDEITLILSNNILPGHIWIGINDAETLERVSHE